MKHQAEEKYSIRYQSPVLKMLFEIRAQTVPALWSQTGFKSSFTEDEILDEFLHLAALFRVNCALCGCRPVVRASPVVSICQTVQFEHSVPVGGRCGIIWASGCRVHQSPAGLGRSQISSHNMSHNSASAVSQAASRHTHTHTQRPNSLSHHNRLNYNM